MRPWIGSPRRPATLDRRRDVDQEAVTPDGEITVPMKMVYSGADPRLELLQTVAGTVWTPADSGVHHIGYWSDDVESDLAALNPAEWPSR